MIGFFRFGPPLACNTTPLGQATCIRRTTPEPPCSDWSLLTHQTTRRNSYHAPKNHRCQCPQSIERVLSRPLLLGSRVAQTELHPKKCFSVPHKYFSADIPGETGVLPLAPPGLLPIRCVASHSPCWLVECYQSLWRAAVGSGFSRIVSAFRQTYTPVEGVLSSEVGSWLPNQLLRNGR